MTNEELLKRFELHGTPIDRDWSPETRDNFVAIARLVHDAGWDWYWISVRNNPQLRFGRKDVGRANGQVCGVLRPSHSDQITFRFGKRALNLAERPVFLIRSAAPDVLSQLVHDVRPPATPENIRTMLDRDPFWADRYGVEEAQSDEEDAENMPLGESEGKLLPERGSRGPMNRILYGPPGTGKTFSSMRHAVAMIEGDEWLDGGRHGFEEVRSRYKELLAAKQIEFVTFHQSYAYEDFVEGLRPTLNSSELEEGGQSAERSNASGGFELKAVPGVFHRISTRAEQARQAAGHPVPSTGGPSAWMAGASSR